MRRLIGRAIRWFLASDAPRPGIRITPEGAAIAKAKLTELHGQTVATLGLWDGSPSGQGGS